MSYQAGISEQQCIDLTGEQAQKPVVQEQETIDQEADVEEAISRTVSDDDQIQELDQSFWLSLPVCKAIQGGLPLN